MAITASMPERTWYSVTQCRTCHACGDTALVIEPGRYACVLCGETGRVHAGGFGNVPDGRPDPALRVVLKGILEASVTMQEFVTLAKVRQLQTPRLVEAARARPLT